LGPMVAPIELEDREVGTEVVTAGEIAMLETAGEEIAALEMDAGETAKLEVDDGETTKPGLDDGETATVEVDPEEITMGEMGEPEIALPELTDEMLPVTDGTVLETDDTVPSVCEVNVRTGACKVVVVLPTIVPTVEVFGMADCVV
jgi:hypothetical protein